MQLEQDWMSSAQHDRHHDAVRACLRCVSAERCHAALKHLLTYLFHCCTYSSS